MRVGDVTMTASVHETEGIDGIITAEADTGSDGDAITACDDDDGDGDGNGMLADAEADTEAADPSSRARSDGYTAGVTISAPPALPGGEAAGCATTSSPYDGGGAQSPPLPPSLPHYTQRLSAPCLLQVHTTKCIILPTASARSKMQLLVPLRTKLARPVVACRPRSQSTQ
jgi:hypothetical protein